MSRIILSIIAAVAVTFSSISFAGNTDTAAKAEQAKIVVYRDSSKMGASFSVFADSKKVGRLHEGRAISINVTPGKHTIASNIRGSESIVVNVEAGETVYIDGELIKKRSGKYATTFAEVSEEVAMASNAKVGKTI